MASGDTLLVFTPLANEPPVSNYATLDARNNHPLLDFDDSTNEVAVFSAVLPRHYNGGGVTARVTGSWTSDTDDTHYTRIFMQFERIGDSQQDVDEDGFTGAMTTVIYVNSTSGKTGVGSIMFASGGGLDNATVGDLFRLKVTRGATSDDATGDFELHSIELVET